MAGDERRRFCTACSRAVLDFAQLTPRQIQAHLEASRGKLCARLTMRGGRLEVREPARVFSRPLARRVSPMAAGLVTSWLSLSAGAQAQPAPLPIAVPEVVDGESAIDPELEADEVEEVATGTLRGRVTRSANTGAPFVRVFATEVTGAFHETAITGKEGEFLFESLPVGIYDVEVDDLLEARYVKTVIVDASKDRSLELAPRWSIDAVTLGIVVEPPKSMRQRFEESDLVVTALVGATQVLEVDDGIARVATELEIEQVFKGSAERTISYRHTLYVNGDEADLGEEFSDIEPGTRLLAFLVEQGERGDRADRVTYETNISSGIKRLERSEREIYRERLEELAKLEGRAERRDGFDPADLVEWLVATVENPQTRREALSELAEAQAALLELAEQEEIEVAVLVERLRPVLERPADEIDATRPLLVATAIDDLHQERLKTALLATRTFTEADRGLFALVRAWDEGAALGWLDDRLLTAEPDPAEGQDFIWWLGDIAEDLETDAGEVFVEFASEEMQALEDSWEDLDGQAERRDREMADLQRGLMRELAAVLAQARAQPQPE